MNRFIRARLSAMMFLQFFVWGAWYSTIAVYMSEHGMGNLTHWPYTVNPLAAIVAPFFLGLVADRFFATEKILGVLHLLGGVFILLAPSFVDRPLVFILLILAHNLCYMPTLGLANTLAFHHVTDSASQFPLIRVFGTLGWIAVGLFISFGLSAFTSALPEFTALPLYTSGVAAFILSAYCFTLPHTPPQAAGEVVSIRSILGLDALKHLGSRSFYMFLLSSLLICIPLTAYYNYTQTFLGAAGVERIAATQTLGQMSEVFFMLLMPIFFARLGVKWMLGVAMGAWVVRYVLFSLAAPDAVFWMIVGGILLHGICYDFFFVTGQIYVDKKATPAIRGQAQGLIVLVTNGIGMFIGAQVAGNIYNGFLQGADGLSLDQWQGFWLVPAAFALLVLVFFTVMFKDDVTHRTRKPAGETLAAP